MSPRRNSAGSVIDQAIEEKRPLLAAHIEARVRRLFDAFREEFGPHFRGVYNSREASTYTTQVVPVLAKAPMPPKPDWDTASREEKEAYFRFERERPYVLDEVKLKDRAWAQAGLALTELRMKLEQKLVELDNAQARGLTGIDFEITGTRDGRAVRIHQSMIVNYSSRGKPFNQFPALIYVDGKKTSEKKYKEMLAALPPTRSNPWVHEMDDRWSSWRVADGPHAGFEFSARDERAALDYVRSRGLGSRVQPAYELRVLANPSAGEREKIIGRRTAADGMLVELWSDGAVTHALGAKIPGVPVRRPKTPEAREAALAQGWRFLGDVELYDSGELARLYKAAAKAESPGALRASFAEGDRAKLPALNWVVQHADRDGNPTERVARLPRLQFPGLAVFDFMGGPGSSRGRYVLMERVKGRGISGRRDDDSYEPTGFAFRTLGELWDHLRDYRSEIVRTNRGQRKSPKAVGEIVERFRSRHWGHEADRIIDQPDPDLPDYLVQMGVLVHIELGARRSKEHVDIDFSKEWKGPERGQAHLCFAVTKDERLYVLLTPQLEAQVRHELLEPALRGGAKYRSLTELADIAGGRQTKWSYPDVAAVPLGHIYRLLYFTNKIEGPGFEGQGGKAIFDHQLAEEGGYFPILAADAEGRLWICGGSYSVPAGGIKN